ncbi:MAG TPA: cobalamin biosynthesis protein, partial [Streptosporangiaceae bacterium]
MIGLVAVTAAGRAAAARLAAAWPGETRAYDGPAATALPAAFGETEVVVAFLAVGATVRLLAPLLGGKHDDPGVVCVDEALRFAVPVVGAHAGGGNDLARRVAGVLGAEPVITTASDSAGSVALDEFGADLGFVIEPGSALAAVGTAILSGPRVTFSSDLTWPVPPLPPTVVATPPEPGVPAILVTDRLLAPDCSDNSKKPPGQPDNSKKRPGRPASGSDGPTVIYRPSSLVIGLGASRGVPTAEVGALIDQALDEAGLSPRSVRAAATIDLKQDEPGLVAAVRERGWPLITFPATHLATVPVPHPSDTVRAAVGTPSVAEAAALLAATHSNPISPEDLIVPKRISAHATVAIARAQPRGRLAIVGIGPGARDLLTPRAVAEL